MRRLFPLLLPHAVFVFLLLVSWNRWIEPYVDSGRELMVPARVARGEKLYREVHFHHGPLAPFAGAAIDRVAGRSLPARIAFAALLALLHLEALRRLAARWLPAGRAALAAALAVALAFFLRPGGWLFPFSFDTAIAVASIGWALVFASGGARRDLAAALCLLAALLSRPEMGLAAIAAIALEVRRGARRLALLALAPLAGAGAVYAALSIGTPLPRLVSDGWLALASPPEAFRNVYRAYAGLDRPLLRLTELALAAVLLVLIAALLAAAAAAARAAGERPGPALLAQGVALLLLAGAGLFALWPPASLEGTLRLFPPLVRVVPLALLAAALSRLFNVARSRRPAGLLGGVPDAAVFVAALFASRLLLAAGYAGPYNAFFLPLPVVVACVGLFGAAQRGSPAIGATLPRLVTGSLAVLLVFRLAVLTDAYRRPGWTEVATPAGSLMLAEPVAWTTRAALQDLQRRLAPGATLAGFPEGGFFNFVLHRENSLGIEQFFPGHLDEAGESRIIREIERSPPDAVVRINVLAVGEGARAFGKDYLARLDNHLRQGYRTAAAFGPGARPGARIGDPGFFIEVLAPLHP